jgi:Glu-tRNA(Gln) amidotransferase subunit E-like FAD-binding protein
MEKEISLKCGLEVHQQLDTKKLFCSCPSILRQEKPDYAVHRRLHVVAGESGEIDIAAKYEAIKNLDFEYQSYYDNTCLVELDESPPNEINQEALKIAIQLALLLNCEILPYTQIMRKTVIDGSNVSGFQRTLLIARKGGVETKEGRVGIDSLALEEDAARIIEKNKGKAVYRLDRLGIPLVEISTSPDIKNEKQAKEVALHIGEILRACKVKRGIGTIRQDVNMSISYEGNQGSRIEIKGVQEPDLIEKTLLTEIERQKRLIKQGKSEAEVRKALEDGKTEFLRPLPGAARMYPETDLPLLHISRDFINEAKRTLPKLKSELKGELKEKGLSEEMIKLVLQENKVNELMELLHVCDNVNLAAKMLVLWPKEIQTKLKLSDKQLNERLSIDVLETVLHAVCKGKITEADIKHSLEKIASGTNIEKALEKEKVENIEEEILKIVKEKPGLSINAYMGLAMSKFKGKISGKEIIEVLKRILK